MTMDASHHPATLCARRLLMSGRVQGVGFRDALRDEAIRLHLRGWCRNLPDGRVEAFAQGASDDLDALTRWCHQGPPLAQVARALTQEAALDARLAPTFEIRL